MDARIIPAYAGSTEASTTGRCARSDHPRVCGEHPASRSRPAVGWGSSPRMRGAPGFPGPRGYLLGIIPAYAGSTRVSTRGRTSRRDHPRVCGEHDPVRMVAEDTGGSSPRMRGARRRQAHAGRGVGIIPAYAGSTPARRSTPTTTRDHPRVCGEHAEAKLADYLRRGSSPRMRGARVAGAAQPGARGIIPAYAGSTPSRPGRWRSRGDHPRVCGEHVYSNAKLPLALGSSPRMRGAHDVDHALGVRVGIIPAYAGSTLKYLVRYEQTSSFSFTSQGSKPPDIIAERPSNHPFLSAEFPCAVILARFAPTFLRRPCERGFFCSARPPNQLQAVAVDRLPVRLMNLERHAAHSPPNKP